MNDEERYKRATAKVEALKGFYTHLMTFCVVGLMLFLINMITLGSWWFYWPMLFWGVGLALHALSVFVFCGLFDKNWEERKIRQYMGDTDHERSSAPPAGAG